MARPRIFVSSTYYDLKHLRSSLDNFIASLGYEPILSEKGDIAYAPDAPLDESCYREVTNTDVFVLIIGGRYGSEASGGSKAAKRAFFDRYDSITRKEYEEAVRREVPTYILIEASVYSEYQTYIRNKTTKDINYAHVDSVNIFNLIEDVLAKPKNNPMKTFERFSEIESWLREQWAGLFRELLHRMSQQGALSALSSQIEDLKDINETLKTYLEKVMTTVSPTDSTQLIEAESRKHEARVTERQLAANRWVSHSKMLLDIDLDTAIELIRKAKSFSDYKKLLAKQVGVDRADELYTDLQAFDAARRDFNKARRLLGAKSFRMTTAQQSA